MPRHSNLADARATATDLTSAALRVAVAAILIWGALTKLVAGQKIGALAETWAAAGLSHSQLWVTLSIGIQLVLALLLLVGLFTRTAGLLNGVNFAVAAAISGIFTSGSNWWPFALLIVLLLHFGMLGAGKLSIDRMRSRRLAAASLRQEGSLEELLISIGLKPRSDDGNYPDNRRG